MEILTSAELLTEEFEKLPAGDRGAETLYNEATTAIAAKRSAAAAALFNDDVVPASHDLLSLYRFHTERWSPSRHVDGLIALHRRALGTVPLLCALLRSPEAMLDMAAAAGSTGTPASFQESHQQAQDAAAARARARVERAIADQLAAAGGDLSTAANDLAAAEDLAARAAAARLRHEQAASAAAAAAAAAARKAQEAADDATDAAAGELELERVLQSHGLPLTLRAGEFATAQAPRCRLLAKAKRRLLATHVDALRLDFGQGRGLYSCRNLAMSISDSSAADLQALIHRLDVAEGKDCTS